ncbi:MAG: hypothetical protein QM658_07900 [Gordonia sp. (in: high G+C Gram-positive bacteria)]
MTVKLNSAQRSALKYLAEQQGDPVIVEQVAAISTYEGQPTMAIVEVDRSLPKCSIKDGPAPVVAAVVDREGELAGELIFWVQDGFVDQIEQTWYGDDPPVSLPSREFIRTYPELGY